MEKKYICKNVSLYGNDIDKKREEILEYFNTTFTHFELLFDTFKDDSVFYEQPEPLRHKLIFYFGHTATFFINKLVLGKYLKQRLDHSFESIFAIGVDEMSWDDLNQDNYAWPTAAETKVYRSKVRKAISEFIQTVEFSLPITWDSPMWTVLMGIEHERIHIETSSVLHRQLDQKFVKEHEQFNICDEYSTTAYPANELLAVTGAKIALGKSFENDTYYGWDNEYGKYTEDVKDFKTSKYLVSNGEFLEFVKAGGYEDKEYWSAEGQSWLEYTGAKYPTFWIKDADGFKYKTLTTIMDFPMDWPVDVNFLEAEAFCKYLSKKSGKNITLPSEAMYNRLRDISGVADEPKEGSANINFEFYSSSCPVDKFDHNGFYDVVGNVWQWTTTPIDEYEGFKIHPLYDDFSVPTFDTRHNLIKGGSWASTGNEVLKDARYAFRRHFFQHAGFRYVEVEELNASEIKDKGFIAKDLEFDVNVSAILKDVKSNKRALHIGCDGSTKLTDLLAEHFDEVIGIDFTARNIQVAEDKNTKENVKFWQGDACNLKPHFKEFDLIISTNKKEQLYNYEKFIHDMNERLSGEGVLELDLR